MIPPYIWWILMYHLEDVVKVVLVHTMENGALRSSLTSARWLQGLCFWMWTAIHLIHLSSKAWWEPSCWCQILWSTTRPNSCGFVAIKLRIRLRSKQNDVFFYLHYQRRQVDSFDWFGSTVPSHDPTDLQVIRKKVVRPFIAFGENGHGLIEEQGPWCFFKQVLRTYLA